MQRDIDPIICKAIDAKEVIRVDIIQELWSGYGKILRYHVTGGSYQSVIVKHIKLEEASHHPRGWNTDISHQRKLQSYEIEKAWYQHYSHQCNDYCKVPDCIAVHPVDDALILVLEDLDAVGYPVRKTQVNWSDIELCISWLANFHATYMHKSPEGLWPVGTYWHLATRPDELEALTDMPLKKAAKTIDTRLNNTQFKSFVHGDAKLTNFCFSEDGQKVAAVDFQYVGGGCGMKDLAYFIGSCLYEEDCEKYESDLLGIYFDALKSALQQRNTSIDFHPLEGEWRELFPFAWADFHRFLKGWSPGHWKINSYSEKLCRQVINSL